MYSARGRRGTEGAVEHLKTLRCGTAHEFLEMPARILVSRTVALPPPLRHLRKDVPKTFAAASNAQLRIAFPPEGARVALGLAAAAPPDLESRRRGFAAALDRQWRAARRAGFAAAIGLDP